LLKAELDKVDNPGRLIIPTILSMFAAGGFIAYVDSGETVGLHAFAFMGLPAIALFGYHFFGRKDEIHGIQNEIAQVENKIAALRRECPEGG
jgi:hypothetical protein